MKILVSSPAFLPNLGGLEIVTDQLATLWATAGHEVALVTRTPGARQEKPYRILREPPPLELLRAMRWCDLFCQQNVSLREIWPLLVVRRPWIVAHHSWYTRTDGRLAWQDRLKRWLVHRADLSIAVSRAVAEDVGGETLVIENPYRDELFRCLPGIDRSRDLVCVGRLVSDKGFDLLLDALGELRDRGVSPGLSIVGDGPESERLLQLVDRLGLGSQVRFLGSQRDEDLVRTLNQHRILVVPSRYNEPFGIVALEGIACGCTVVGSAGGGLADAIGPCGRTFPNGNSHALAAILESLLEDTSLMERSRLAAGPHLRCHTGPAVARNYLGAFEQIQPRLFS